MRNKWRLFGLMLLILFSTGCFVTDFFAVEVGVPLYASPSEATKYIAETQENIEIYVLLDDSGRVVEFTQGAAYASAGTAKLRYRLEFWDVGAIKEREMAIIYRVITPFRVTGVNSARNFSEEQRKILMARTDFFETYQEWQQLRFSGGPDGQFSGTNAQTGKEIRGELVWDKDRKELRVVFTQDIKQTYLVFSDQIPFSNWHYNK